MGDIAASDGSYAVLEQGDYIICKVPALDEPAEGTQRSFVIAGSGYYYTTGPEVPQDKIENMPLVEELSATPLAYNQWILPRYVAPDSYPYSEYYDGSPRWIVPPLPVDWRGVYGGCHSLYTDYVKITVTERTDGRAPAPVYLTATDPDTSSVLLRWTAPGDDDMTGVATSYDVRYSSSGAITEGNWASATQAAGEPTPNRGWTPQNFEVTGLSASTQYWFAIKATDDQSNTSPISNSPTCTTATSADSTAPGTVTLTTSNVTATTVTLRWTAPADDGSTNTSGAAYSYDIRYRKGGAVTEGNWAAATTATGEPKPGAPGTAESFVVTGLDENYDELAASDYWFGIKATDEKGNTASLSATGSGARTIQPDLEVGEWWMWEMYYNSEYGNNPTARSNYHINRVSQVDQSAVVYADSDTGTGQTVTGLAVIDWSTDHTFAGSDTASNWNRRQRTVTAPVVTRAWNSMWDAQCYVQANDPTLWIYLDAIPVANNTPTAMGDAVIPSDNYYTYQGCGDCGTCDCAPAADDGYPYDTAETVDAHLYTHSHGTYVAATDRELHHDWDWAVAGTTADYDTSDPTVATEQQGVGVYDVWRTSFTESGVGTTSIWYAPEVHNAVRKTDCTSYLGHEDWLIQTYEVDDFKKENLTLTDYNQGQSLDVSIDVTNTTGEPRRFNLILMVEDLDAVTDDPFNHNHPYIDGKTVYPDMYNPIVDGAVQQTELLMPGQSQTITWSNIWTVPASTNTLQVWVNGVTSSTWDPS